MGKVGTGLSMSLDGFIGGPNDGPEQPLGEGGYVVVPSSRTQGSYEWVDRSPFAEASWLIEHLIERHEATLF